MNKVYSRIDWKNYPSMSTPLNETNLNRMDKAVDDEDNRIIELDTNKVNVADISNNIKSWTMDETTGIITITKYDDSQVIFDLNIEKIPVKFELSSDGILTMTTADGTKFTANIGAMIPVLTFNDSDTIAVTVSGEGINKVYSFRVKNNSITEDKLQPNFLADIKVESGKAEKAASDALVSSVNAKTSETNAKTSEDNTHADYLATNEILTDVQDIQTHVDEVQTTVETSETNAKDSENNAKTYMDSAESYMDTAETYKNEAEASATTATDKASEASDSATSASESKETAIENALKSEGHAVGQQNGVDVGEESPYYRNNAKYWAGQAKSFSNIGNGTITIKQGDTVRGTFEVNQETDTEIDLSEGITADDTLSLTSENAVQNKILSKVLLYFIDTSILNTEFYSVFTNIDVEEDPNALNPSDVETAINTVWDGSSSEDENALSSTNVIDAINTEWDGSSSEDSKALKAYQINDIVKNL